MGRNETASVAEKTGVDEHNAAIQQQQQQQQKGAEIRPRIDT
jgi:hypothetical protein